MSHPISIAGIPLPSSAPWFLAIIGVHVTAGLVAVVAGIVAMVSPKAAGRHPRAGSVYFWALMIVGVTMAVVVMARWPSDNYLGLLGVIAVGAAYVGRRVRREARRAWECVHIPCMSVSYIALVTAFYVDNGPHLPFWRHLPTVALWVLPSAVGVPLLAVAWWKHCPPRRRGRGKQALDPAI